MRLTTKIILGVILSIFLIAIIFIVGFSFSERKNYQRPYTTTTKIPQDNLTGISVEPYRVILFEVENTDPDNKYPYGFAGDINGIFLNPITTPDEENKLFIPGALRDFISAQTLNDTLHIQLKITDLCEKYKEENKNIYLFSGIRLQLNTSTVDYVNKESGINTFVSHIETNRIKINSSGGVHIDSCKAEVIDPVISSNYNRLTVTNCIAGKIYLDLDRGNHWNIENNNIEEQILTGSKTHGITHHKNESGKISWQPKNKEAKLNVTIQGDTTQIILR